MIPGFDEFEVHMMVHAILVHPLHPFIMAFSCSVIVFPADDDAFDFSGRQMLRQVDFADQRCGHDASVFERQIQEYRDPPIGHLLVFGRDIHPHVFPTVSPIFRKAIFHAFDSFRQQIEQHIRPLLDHLPDFPAPLVRFLQKEVRSHADAYRGTRRYDKVAAPVSFQRSIEAALDFVNQRAIFSSLTIQMKHITILASRADLFAAVPRVPDITQATTPLKRSGKSPSQRVLK